MGEARFQTPAVSRRLRRDAGLCLPKQMLPEQILPVQSGVGLLLLSKGTTGQPCLSARQSPSLRGTSGTDAALRNPVDLNQRLELSLVFVPVPVHALTLAAPGAYFGQPPL